MMRPLTCMLSGLLFMAAPVYAQTHALNGNSFVLDGNWKYHSGDHPEWAAPEDDVTFVVVKMK